MNKREIKKYFIDILARMSQVIFTLLIVTPFLTDIFNWTLLTFGSMLFILVVVSGFIISGSIEEV